MTAPKNNDNTEGSNAVSVESTALFCLQASDVFNEWETVYQFPTRKQAERMKEIREAEPVIYCPVHWRIIEQNERGHLPGEKGQDHA